MIQDQRHMFNASDVDSVVAYWDAVLEQRGLRRHPSKLTVAAYVNHSRWVADCPACNDGIACWPDHPQGCCLGCGAEFTVEFPHPNSRAAAEKHLLERANPRNRNWDPATEDVDRIKAETTLLEGAIR